MDVCRSRPRTAGFYRTEALAAHGHPAVHRDRRAGQIRLASRQSHAAHSPISSGVAIRPAGISASTDSSAASGSGADLERPRRERRVHEPGQTAFTRMPRSGVLDGRRAREPEDPVLRDRVADPLRRRRSPFTDDTFTIDPDPGSTIWRSSARTHSHVPRRFTRICGRNPPRCSRRSARRGPAWVPAMFAAAVEPPKRSTAAATSASTSPGSAMSARTNSAVPPAASHELDRLLAARGVDVAATTDAPRAPSVTAAPSRSPNRARAKCHACHRAGTPTRLTFLRA